MFQAKNFIQKLGKQTESRYSAENEVKRAFLLGLHLEYLPVYVVEYLEVAYSWDLHRLIPEAEGAYKYELPCEVFKFQFISEKGDSWHQIYRDLRQLNWQRLHVWREGGRLQYLMQLLNKKKPEEFQQVWLMLDISIQTCKQVQVGTKKVEQPIYETQCEDLVEIDEEQSEPEPVKPFSPMDRDALKEQISKDTDPDPEMGAGNPASFEDDIPF